MQTIIIRLSFSKGSDNIHVGLTRKDNLTLTGEIVYCEDLIVSYYNEFVPLAAEDSLGKVGTICFEENEEALALIDEIDTIQANRPINEKGNKYPFVFISVIVENDPIFNKGVNGEPDRITILDVDSTLVEVNAEAPKEVLGLVNKPITKSQYGTRDFRQVKNLRNSNLRKSTTNGRKRGPINTAKVARLRLEEAVREGLKSSVSQSSISNLSQEDNTSIDKKLLKDVIELAGGMKEFAKLTPEEIEGLKRNVSLLSV